MPRFNLVKQMSESKAVIGLNMLTLWKDRGIARARGSRRCRRCSTTAPIQPVVGGEFPFEEAGAAQNMITERRNVGKVVLDAVVRFGAAAARGAKLRRRCRSQVSLSRFSAPPSGGIARGGRVAANPAERKTTSETREGSTMTA